MTFEEDMDVMRFLAAEVEAGRMAQVGFIEAQQNSPRARQMKQLVACAIAWGRAATHASRVPENEPSPPAFENRFDGLELHDIPKGETDEH